MISMENADTFCIAVLYICLLLVAVDLFMEYIYIYSIMWTNFSDIDVDASDAMG